MSARMRRAAGAVLPWIAGALLLSGPARAADDAGTTSPFSRGAGGRASGMGGAFAAVAADATALMWNPGGLALVQKLGFEVGLSRLDETGVAEQLAAVALPSWRWGVVGLTLRQVGVGGIEQRDAGNQPLPGELDAGERELALGYATRVAPGFAIGGAFKIEQQSIGGVSGGGLGADLGLRFDPVELASERWSWAAPLSVGLAVRNALEPRLRLASDDVADPRRSPSRPTSRRRPASRPACTAASRPM